MRENRGAVLGNVATVTAAVEPLGLRDKVRQRARWFLAHGVWRLGLRGPLRRGDLQARLIFPPPRPGPEDLLATFTEIRETGPFYSAAFGLVTAHHAVCREVLTSGDLASIRPRLGAVGAWLESRLSSGIFDPLQPPSLLVAVPPQHTRYRSLISKAFTNPAIRTLRGGIEDISVELLDGLEPGEELDLVRRYCRPMPLTLVCDILGIPLDQVARVQELGKDIGGTFDLAMDWTSFREAERVQAAIDALVSEHIETLRAHPGPDLLSRLITLEDDGDRLSEEELRSFAALVLSAGFDTTVNLVGSGIKLLAEHPDQLALLREQPDLWPNAIEEILRLDTPTMWTARTAVRDTEIAGRRIAKGTLVSVLLAGANRDPALFADPDRMDVTRENARDHLAFSAGRHYCFGAMLGRLEGAIALQELFDRYDVELLPGARRRDTRVVHGWERLPAKLTRRG